MTTIKWNGPTDVTLHRLTRTQLISQLQWALDNSGEHSSSNILCIRRNGTKESIVAVREDKDGVFVYTFDTSTPYLKSIIEMAPMLGSELSVLTADSVIKRLKKCKKDDVWLQFPSENLHTVVGKVFAVNNDGNLTIGLVPVPKNIEEINEQVRVKCAEHGCKKANDGLSCGMCSDVGSCKILREIDSLITKEKEQDE